MIAIKTLNDLRSFIDNDDETCCILFDTTYPDRFNELIAYAIEHEVSYNVGIIMRWFNHTPPLDIDNVFDASNEFSYIPTYMNYQLGPDAIFICYMYMGPGDKCYYNKSTLTELTNKFMTRIRSMEYNPVLLIETDDIQNRIILDDILYTMIIDNVRITRDIAMEDNTPEAITVGTYARIKPNIKDYKGHTVPAYLIDSPLRIMNITGDKITVDVGHAAKDFNVNDIEVYEVDNRVCIAGEELNLKGVNIYTTARSIVSASVVFGRYYIYDGNECNMRYMIVRYETEVQKRPASDYVVGWINKADIN